jgi:hypothetical protein
VVDWFKSKGPGYYTRMPRILRQVMVEGKKREGKGYVDGARLRESIALHRTTGPRFVCLRIFCFRIFTQLPRP